MYVITRGDYKPDIARVGMLSLIYFPKDKTFESQLVSLVNATCIHLKTCHVV